MIYLNKEGHRISSKEWHRLRADESYTLVREFSNSKVAVRLMWHGALTSQEYASFPETWPVFRMSVRNFGAEGSTYSDPVMDGKTFSTQLKAILAYEEFLCKWTESFVEDGKLVEVDNELAPPPPPDPNVPSSTVKDFPSDFTAW